MVYGIGPSSPIAAQLRCQVLKVLDRQAIAVVYV